MTDDWSGIKSVGWTAWAGIEEAGCRNQARQNSYASIPAIPFSSRGGWTCVYQAEYGQTFFTVCAGSTESHCFLAEFCGSFRVPYNRSQPQSYAMQ